MIPLLENNKLILKRVDGWGWGHSHHVYFTGNQQFNMQDISFNKNIEKNYIKIKIEKSDLYKKIVKLSVPLNQNTSLSDTKNQQRNAFCLLFPPCLRNTRHRSPHLMLCISMKNKTMLTRVATLLFQFHIPKYKLSIFTIHCTCPVAIL